MRMNVRIAICFACGLLAAVPAQVSLSSTALRNSGAVTLTATGPAGSPLWLLADVTAGPAVYGSLTFGLGLSPALVVVESPSPFDPAGALTAAFTLDPAVLAGTPLWMQLATIDPTGPSDGMVLSNTVHRVVHPRDIAGLGASGFCSGANPAFLANDEVATVPLGMTFQYYGVDFTEVMVDSNGLVTFGTSAVSDPLASATRLSAKSAVIAVLWADLDPSVLQPAGDPRNKIQIDRETGSHCRFTWNQVQRPGDPAESSASLSLWCDGSITMEWGAVSGPVTVGMNALGGSGIASVDISASDSGVLPAFVGFAQEFASAGAFDLSSSILTLRPNGLGGYLTRIN